MFNGLDELEEFAEQLAPLTPEEAAEWEKKKAAETKRSKPEPTPDNTTDKSPVQEIAPELGTIPEPVSEIVAKVEPPPARTESPKPAPAPSPEPEVIHKAEAPLPESADDVGYRQASKPTPLQNTAAENEAVQQVEVEVEVLEPQPALASQPESKPKPTQIHENIARPCARYVIVGGILLLGVVTLLL